MKHLNIARTAKATSREISAGAWDRKVATARQIIATATYNLSQEWCVGTYADTARRDIAKAEATLAKLMAVNPYAEE